MGTGAPEWARAPLHQERESRGNKQQILRGTTTWIPESVLPKATFLLRRFGLSETAGFLGRKWEEMEEAAKSKKWWEERNRKLLLRCAEEGEQVPEVLSPR